MGAAAFLAPEALLAGGPRRFNLAVERLLLHLGFDDIRLIDGAGDGGGDILAHRKSDEFVFQCKWTTGVSGISCVSGHDGKEGAPPWPDGKTL